MFSRNLQIKGSTPSQWATESPLSRSRRLSIKATSGLGKTKKSLAVIDIPQDLSDELQAWPLQCEERTRQLLRRTRQSLRLRMTSSSPTRLEDSSIPTTIANGCSTNSFAISTCRSSPSRSSAEKSRPWPEAGTVKDVQGVLRHSRTATTMDVDMQEIPASVQSTINSINRELRRSLPTRQDFCNFGMLFERNRQDDDVGLVHLLQ